MAFPKTRAEMETQGYRLAFIRKCRECPVQIHWYLTPRGKHAPMDPMIAGDSPAISHFSTCPKALQFKK